ncbi:hypothetical protein Phi46:1_gp46 [Cellulophaga phage phi46:1]|uniref:hypothetical protein n=1 Tax=Cellulophaga phage phi46:1 TaxID=1327974 RepID=UPI00035194F6|nr:hypothetical protein Phi46:1_gp46 [Cellulophaga phage phi46:1]AGO47857.1 hypothetical protein Phi46:1_gp46 [Cellulophaga phage phi46:1]
MKTFKVEFNEKYQEHRVVEYLNGEWINEYDGNFSKEKAEKIAKNKRQQVKIESNHF